MTLHLVDHSASNLTIRLIVIGSLCTGPMAPLERTPSDISTLEILPARVSGLEIYRRVPGLGQINEPCTSFLVTTASQVEDFPVS